MVADAPEIQVEKNWVHTGENEEAELVCIVNAEPAAEVSAFNFRIDFDLKKLRRISENEKFGKFCPQTC